MSFQVNWQLAFGGLEHVVGARGQQPGLEDEQTVAHHLAEVLGGEVGLQIEPSLVEGVGRLHCSERDAADSRPYAGFDAPVDLFISLVTEYAAPPSGRLSVILPNRMGLQRAARQELRIDGVLDAIRLRIKLRHLHQRALRARDNQRVAALLIVRDVAHRGAAGRWIERQQPPQCGVFEHGRQSDGCRHADGNDDVIKRRWRGPLGPNIGTVAPEDESVIRIDARGFQQSTHERRLVLAVAVVFRENALGRVRCVAAAARDVERHEDVVHLLHERGDGFDLVQLTGGAARQLGGLSLDGGSDGSGRVGQLRHPHGNRTPVVHTAQARVGPLRGIVV